MANYIEAAEKIAQELEHFMPEILKNETTLHRYFEFISFCSQVYLEYVSKELDTKFVKLNYRIVPRPYRFSNESRIVELSSDANRIFCIESATATGYLFIAGCEKIQEQSDNENFVFAFNCDFYGIEGLKSFSMFYLTICEALSILRKNSPALAQNPDYSTLNSWIRQHSGKVSKQYFMAQTVSTYFTTFALFSRFVDFNVYSGSGWDLDRIYQSKFPEGITIQGENKYIFTAVKEVVSLPGAIGPIAGSNIYLSRLGHVDYWRDVKNGLNEATLLRQPTLHEDSFKDLVDDVRNYILDEIQF